MEDKSQLEILLQEELKKLVASRTSMDSAIPDIYEKFLREKLEELSSCEDQTIEIAGNVGPASVVGYGSIRAGVIAGGNVILSDNEEEKAQLAEEEYLTTLIRINTRLFLGPLDAHCKYSSSSPDLARIYIPLDVIATVPLEGDAGDILGKDRSLSVVEIISQHKQLALLGDPGSGKSTVLKYLTWCLAAARLQDLSARSKEINPSSTTLATTLPGWQEQALLPIPITLSDLARWMVHRPSSQIPTIDDYLKYYLSIVLDTPDFAKYIHNILRKGQAIFFFDGLDEITDLEARKKALLLLKQFIRIHPDTRVIVTCRVLSYSNPTLQLGKGFAVHTLAGLTLDQAHQFIRNWYNLLIEKKDLRKDVALLRASNLERLVSLGLAEFRSTPLLLTVMVIVHASTGDLPREKARLYNQCCEILLWQWQQAKADISGEIQPGIYDLLGTRIVELRSALARLAYQHYSRKDMRDGTSNISETDIIRTFRGFLGYNLNDPQGSADAFKKAKLFLDYIQFQAGLLIAKGSSDDAEEPTYAFIHRTFQEFLAGYYLTTQRDLNRRLFDLICSEDGDQWIEVMRMAIGHMVFNSSRVEDAIDAAKYIFYSKYRTATQEKRAVWWAAEMLAIVGKEQVEKDEVAGKNLLPEVCIRLTELLNAENFSPRYLEAAGKALSKIGDPRKSVTNIPPTCVVLTGGVFTIGIDESVSTVSRNEQPQSFISLEPLEMSLHPITNAQFRPFINDDGYSDKHKDCWLGEGWRWRVAQNWERPEFIDDPDLGIDNKPVVGVSWFEAIAYVNWLSKIFNTRYRLPTEAEWERAARGTEARLYTWGNIWQENAANTSELGLDVPVTVGVFRLSHTAEGGTDMIGNVWEWCQSLYSVYPYNVNDGRENLDAIGPRILRGGSYQISYRLSRCTYRMWRFPAYRNRYTGFRVVLIREK